MKQMSNPGLYKHATLYGNHSSLDELLRGDQPIWVLNNSEPLSLLLLTIQDPVSGKPYNLEFHRTFVPYCLTDMVPREVFAQSLQVRNFIRKGLLKVLTQEEAMSILSSERGRKEYQRLMTSEFSKGAVKGEAGQALIDSAAHSQGLMSGISLQNPSIDYNQIELHPKMRGLESRVVVGELDGEAVMHELTIHERELSKIDLEFILAAQFPKEAKEFASANLSAGKFKAAPVTVTTAASTKAPGANYEPDYE